MANTIGKCALCRKENVELMQSHIIPKAIYRRTRTFENSRFREYYDPHKILQDGEKKPMLCHECEEFFSRYETQFIKQYLDIYLAAPESNLPDITDEVDFYILTVAWRVLYDDLYVHNSYSDAADATARDCFESLEEKLGKYIFERYVSENSGTVNTRNPAMPEPNLEGLSFGEKIAAVDKWQKNNAPEDMSEIKNYVYKFSDLGFDKSVADLFDSMILGYSFCDSTRTKFYIITSYNGLVIATVYLPSRNVLITDDAELMKKASKSENRIKEDIAEEIIWQLSEMSRRNPEVQAKLDENGLREKIADRYKGKQPIRQQKDNKADGE